MLFYVSQLHTYLLLTWMGFFTWLPRIEQWENIPRASLPVFICSMIGVKSVHGKNWISLNMRKTRILEAEFESVLNNALSLGNLLLGSLLVNQILTQIRTKSYIGAGHILFDVKITAIPMSNQWQNTIKHSVATLMDEIRSPNAE